jgi:hypothetical protein
VSGCVVEGTAVIGIKIGDGSTAWNSLPGPMDVIVHPELVAGTAIILGAATGTWPDTTQSVAVDLVDEDDMASDSAVRTRGRPRPAPRAPHPMQNDRRRPLADR